MTYLYMLIYMYLCRQIFYTYTSIYTDRYIAKSRKRFITSCWITWLGRLGSPTVCHMQAGDPEKPAVFWRPKNLGEEPKVHIPVWVWSPEKQECWAGGDECLSSSCQTEMGCIQSSSTFLFYSHPQQTAWCPPTLGRSICFPQSTNPKANLFEITLTATQK